MNLEPINFFTTKQSNYSPISDTSAFSVRNGICSLDGVISINSPSVSWITVGTIPSEYLPKMNIYIPCHGWAGNMMDLAILTNGDIQMRNGNKGSNVYIHASW